MEKDDIILLTIILICIAFIIIAIMIYRKCNNIYESRQYEILYGSSNIKINDRLKNNLYKELDKQKIDNTTWSLIYSFLVSRKTKIEENMKEIIAKIPKVKAVIDAVPNAIVEKSIELLGGYLAYKGIAPSNFEPTQKNIKNIQENATSCLTNIIAEILCTIPQIRLIIKFTKKQYIEPIVQLIVENILFAD